MEPDGFRSPHIRHTSYIRNGLPALDGLYGFPGRIRGSEYQRFFRRSPYLRGLYAQCQFFLFGLILGGGRISHLHDHRPGVVRLLTPGCMENGIVYFHSQYSWRYDFFLVRHTQ